MFPGEELAEMEGQPPPKKHGISRRTVIIGLVSLGAAATAGITLYTLAQSGVLKLSPALFTYRGHSQDVTSVAWSPDGKRIVSTSDDETAQVWEPLTGKQFVIFRGHDGIVQDAAWSPDGSRIASCGWGAVQIWDAITGNVSLSYQGHTRRVNAIAWSPDDKRIASVSENVQVWDAASGKRFYAIGSSSDSLSNVVAWSPDGLYLATCPSSGFEVHVHNASTGKTIFAYTGHSAEVESVAWSPDGQLIASGSINNTVRVWRLTEVNVSDLTVYAYNGHSDSVNQVAWSPDSTRIASASGYVPVGRTDNTVQVWDATTGDNAYTYNGHSSPVTGLTWSPDGKYLASSSVDKTVQVWKAPS
jgi:WD40 repeat protein